MTPSVTITLPRDLSQLVSAALRYAADCGDARVAADPDADWQELDQTGQLRWAATYIDHKIQDVSR
jgi:hypothetical protein